MIRATRGFEIRSAPALLSATLRAFTFYVAPPSHSILFFLPISVHFRHRTHPSQGGRGYGRNGTKGLTYTLVYSENI